MSDEVPTEREEDGAQAERESPGRLLQAARKRKGLSLDELVAQTLLSRSTLTALEADAFEQLSQPVYVRGYYRKCAKVLDLSEDKLMTAYAEHAGVPESCPVSPGQVDVIPQDVTPRSWRTLNVLLAAVAVAAVVAAAWWLIPLLDPGEAAGGNGAGLERAPLPLLDEGPEPTPEYKPAAPGKEASEVTGEPARLQLLVNERSWVEVRDAGGERLFADVLLPGTERTVAGRSPYEVVLGNAPGVEILLNGERVFFEDRIRDNNTARLTLAVGDGRPTP
jgi:cytoskeleton protein RodZ